MTQFFMLRIRPRMCQGAVPSGPEKCIVGFPRKLRQRRNSPRGKASPTIRSTTAPLTSAVPKPILHGIGHCPTYQDRRKSIETMGREGVYRFETGSSTELLDIGVLRDTLSPGFSLPSEAQCHVNSRLYSSPCSYWSGQ